MTRDGAGEVPSFSFVRPLSRKAKPPSDRLPRYLVGGVKIQGEEGPRFPLRVGPVTVSPPEGGGIRSLNTQAKVPVLQDIETVKEAGLLKPLTSMMDVVALEKKRKREAKAEKKFLKSLSTEEQLEYKRKTAGAWEETDGLSFGGRSPHPFTKGADEPLPYRAGKMSMEEKKYAAIEPELDAALGPFRDKRTRLLVSPPPEDMPLFKRAAASLDVVVPPVARLTTDNLRELRELDSQGIRVQSLLVRDVRVGLEGRMSEELYGKMGTVASSGLRPEELEAAVRDPKKIVSLRKDLVSRYEAVLQDLRGAPPAVAKAALEQMPELGSLWSASAWGRIKGNLDWAIKTTDAPGSMRLKVAKLAKKARLQLAEGDPVGASLALLSAYQHRGAMKGKVTPRTQEAAKSFEQMTNVWVGAWRGEPVMAGSPSLPRTDLMHTHTRKPVHPVGGFVPPEPVVPGSKAWLRTFNPRVVERVEERGSDLVQVGDEPDAAVERALGGTRPGSPGMAPSVEELAESYAERNSGPGEVRWVELPKAAVTPGKAAMGFHGEMTMDPEGRTEFVNPRKVRAQEALREARGPLDQGLTMWGDAEGFSKAAGEYTDELSPEVQTSIDRMMRQADSQVKKGRRAAMPAIEALTRLEEVKPSSAWYKLRGPFMAVRNEYKGLGIPPDLTGDLLKPDPPIRAAIYQAGEWAKEGVEEEEILNRFSGKKFSKVRGTLKILFSENVPEGRSLEPPARDLGETLSRIQNRGRGGLNVNPLMDDMPYLPPIEEFQGRRGAPQAIRPPEPWMAGTKLTHINRVPTMPLVNPETASAMRAGVKAEQMVNRAAPLVSTWEEFAALGAKLLKATKML